MILYRVRDWSKHFENNRTKELKKMNWVPVPNKHDGDGFTDLMSRENGPAMYGAWVLILQVASKCDCRGTLSRQIPAGGCGIPAGGCGIPASYCGGVIEPQVPHTAASISRITRCPESLVQSSIDVCVEIGWIESIELNSNELVNPAPSCDIVGSIPHDDAERCGPFPSLPFPSVQFNSTSKTRVNGVDNNGKANANSPMRELAKVYRDGGRPTNDKDWHYATVAMVSEGITDEEIMAHVIPYARDCLADLAREGKSAMLFMSPEKLFNRNPRPWKIPMKTARTSHDEAIEIAERIKAERIKADKERKTS